MPSKRSQVNNGLYGMEGLSAAGAPPRREQPQLGAAPPAVVSAAWLTGRRRTCHDAKTSHEWLQVWH